MASSATKVAGDHTVPAQVPSFSYAQAAKGRPSFTGISGQTTTGTSSPSRESNSTSDMSTNIPNGTTSLEVERAASEHEDISRQAPKSELTGAEEGKAPVAALPSPHSAPPSPTNDESNHSSNVGNEDTSSLANSASDSPWDRHRSSDAQNDRALEGAERKKGSKKNKKEKPSDKEVEVEKEEPKPEVLVAAPPPTVNIWQQRREAQAAKEKIAPPAAEGSQNTAAEVGATNVQNSSIRSNDARRRSKATVYEESSAGGAQVGNGKDNSPPNKNQKKGADGRTKDDTNARRTGARGSRLIEKDDKSPVIQAPPPVEDSISWPTPETALEDEKRKAQEKVEKEEKEDTGTHKPRTKEKWVAVPYIPTVTFNTPLPTGRGRGRGIGGRGTRDSAGRTGHTSNGSISLDKSTKGDNASTTDARERGRDGNGTGRAASLPPNSSKKSGPDSQLHSNGRQSNISSERPRADASATADKSNGSTSNGQQSANSVEARLNDVNAYDHRAYGGEFTRPHQHDGKYHDGFGRQGGPERRSEPNIRSPEFSRDANHQSHSHERGEGRSDRGRGNYRGRGNHNNFNGAPNFNSSQYANGPIAQNGYAMRPNGSGGPLSPTTPIHQQQSFSPFQPNASNHGSRTSNPNRSYSIPNSSSAVQQRLSMGGPQIPLALQTNGPVYEYNSAMSMSAAPYNAYVEQYSVLAMVSMQLEYYFSIDNLCKDVFLRKHMDGQGFVFLSFIANFKRIQSLTQDIELLRYACQESEVIEIVFGDDGFDRVRRQDGWEKWVLVAEEREESARNNGPERFVRQPSAAQRATMMGPPPPRMMPQGHQALSPPLFSPGGPYAAPPAPVNGTDKAAHIPGESPLSASVPDFSPREPVPHVNGKKYSDVETAFADEEIDKLNLMYEQNGRGESKQVAPFHSASSRTFSNGSFDGRLSVDDQQQHEKRASRISINGSKGGSEKSPEGIRLPASPPTKPVFGNAPPVMWTKETRDNATLPETLKEEPYNIIYARALRLRESAAPGEIEYDMQLLYKFWSHFLIRNFNPKMYDDFRQFAFEDNRQRKTSVGISNLIMFYDQVLNSKKRTIPETFAKHYIELVKAEDPSGDRPAFKQLRMAWRDGALDMKSRKKMDNLVDLQLRKELER